MTSDHPGGSQTPTENVWRPKHRMAHGSQTPKPKLLHNPPTGLLGGHSHKPSPGNPHPHAVWYADNLSTPSVWHLRVKTSQQMVRAFSISGWISSTPGVLLLRSFLTTSETSSARDSLCLRLLPSLQISSNVPQCFHRLTISTVRISSSPPAFPLWVSTLPEHPWGKLKVLLHSLCELLPQPGFPQPF